MTPESTDRLSEIRARLAAATQGRMTTIKLGRSMQTCAIRDGKRDGWWIYAKEGNPIGSVEWYERSSKYLFAATYISEVILSAEALSTLAKFCREKTEARK